MQPNYRISSLVANDKCWEEEKYKLGSNPNEIPVKLVSLQL